MNAVEAMAALIIGKKVRDVDWSNDEYRKVVDGQIVNEFGKTSSIDIDQSYTYEEWASEEDEEEDDEEEECEEDEEDEDEDEEDEDEDT